MKAKCIKDGYKICKGKDQSDSTPQVILEIRKITENVICVHNCG